MKVKLPKATVIVPVKCGAGCVPEPGQPCFVNGEYKGIVIRDFPAGAYIRDGKIGVLQQGTIICHASEDVSAGDAVSWWEFAQQLGRNVGTVLPYTRWVMDGKSGEMVEVAIELPRNEHEQTYIN